MEILVGLGCWGYSVLSRRLSRLQPDCNSSDPLLGLPSRSQVGGPGLGAALLADRSAFVRFVKRRRTLWPMVWAEVSTQFHLSSLLSAVKEREVNKASLSAWEGRLAIVGALTQRGNSAHIGHPAHTHDWPLTPPMNPSMYMQKHEWKWWGFESVSCF